MEALTIRPYTPADLEAVIRLFHSNLAPYFVEAEEAELRQFLQEVSAAGLPYFVAELPDHAGLVAAGGYALHNPYAVLTWGMVDRRLHGQGVGRAFTEFRLAQCEQAYPGVGVEIGTSHLTEGFYTRLGFRTVRVTTDKIGPGLHEVYMLRGA